MQRFRIALAIVLIVVLLTGCASHDASPHTVVTAGRTTLLSASVTAAATTENTTVSSTVTTPATKEATTGSTTTTSSGTTTQTTRSTTIATSGITTTTKTIITATTTSAVTKTTTSAVATTTAPVPSKPTVPPSQPIESELHGAWVSYIELAELFGNCKTAEQAQDAVDAMLSVMRDNKINTVFFHVRANSDAYYDSKLFKPAAVVEQLIASGFDPLTYVVEASHKQGIKVHAWINPYRVGKQTAYLVEEIPTLSDANGVYYYVPTAVATQKLVLDGVREIVDKYAVDGIHYDDYFYPRDTLDEDAVYSFEAEDYEVYQSGGGSLTVGNWRRAAVNSLVAATHTIAEAEGLIFGVSPAADIDDTYAELFADCRKWLAEPGYVDYLCPQIYTGFENDITPFDSTVDAWVAYPRDGSVSLYVGLGLYKIGLKKDNYAGKGKSEWVENDDVMKRSVLYLREKKLEGFCFYSYSFFEPAKKLDVDADISVAEREIENLKDCL